MYKLKDRKFSMSMSPQNENKQCLSHIFLKFSLTDLLEVYVFGKCSLHTFYNNVVFVSTLCPALRIILYYLYCLHYFIRLYMYLPNDT